MSSKSEESEESEESFLLTRNPSLGLAADQGMNPTCWAFAIARIIVNYYRNILPLLQISDLDKDNYKTWCKDQHTVNKMRVIFLDGRCSHQPEEERKINPQYLNNILLFVFIYYYLTTQYTEGGNIAGCGIRDIDGCLNWFFINIKNISEMSDITLIRYIKHIIFSDIPYEDYKELLIHEEVKEQLIYLFKEINTTIDPWRYKIKIPKYEYTDTKIDIPGKLFKVNTFQITYTHPRTNPYHKYVNKINIMKDTLITNELTIPFFLKILKTAIDRCKQYICIELGGISNGHAMAIIGYHIIYDVSKIPTIWLYIKNSWRVKDGSEDRKQWYKTENFRYDSLDNIDIVEVNENFLENIKVLIFLIPPTKLSKKSLKKSLKKLLKKSLKKLLTKYIEVHTTISDSKVSIDVKCNDCTDTATCPETCNIFPSSYLLGGGKTKRRRRRKVRQTRRRKATMGRVIALQN
jgi:hypothetical protein